MVQIAATDDGLAEATVPGVDKDVVGCMRTYLRANGDALQGTHQRANNMATIRPWIWSRLPPRMMG